MMLGILFSQLPLHLSQTLVLVILAQIRPAMFAIDGLQERRELWRNRYPARLCFGPDINDVMPVHGDEVQLAELVLEHLEKVADGPCCASFDLVFVFVFAFVLVIVIVFFAARVVITAVVFIFATFFKSLPVITGYIASIPDRCRCFPVERIDEVIILRLCRFLDLYWAIHVVHNPTRRIQQDDVPFFVTHQKTAVHETNIVRGYLAVRFLLRAFGHEENVASMLFGLWFVRPVDE